jgi:hypothetical protein
MRSTAYLINAVRGPIVDQKALTRVLQEKRIAGVGLDVLEQGPPDPDDPILKLDNVVFAPHALCWTDQCFAGNGAADVRAVIDVQHGRTLQSVVNRDVLSTEIWKKRFAGFAKRFAEQETHLWRSGARPPRPEAAASHTNAPGRRADRRTTKEKERRP